MADTRLITRFGYKPLAVGLLLVIFSYIFSFFFSFFVFILILILYFYKNPEREISSLDEKAIFAPIDGEIISINTINTENEQRLFIEIQKSFLGCGVLRAPCFLENLEFKKRKGLFLCNFLAISKQLNETIQISADLAKQNSKNEENFKSQKVILQILAGPLARRIGILENSSLAAGRRFGFLIDGRVILILPKDCKIIHQVGSKLKATQVLGYFSY